MLSWFLPHWSVRLFVFDSALIFVLFFSEETPQLSPHHGPLVLMSSHQYSNISLHSPFIVGHTSMLI